MRGRPGCARSLSCWLSPDDLAASSLRARARAQASAPRSIRVGAARNFASGPSSNPSSTPASSGGPQAPAEYCASLVQRLDPEAWLTSYFWPRREREWFMAWRAFNVSCFASCANHTRSFNLGSAAFLSARGLCSKERQNGLDVVRRKRRVGSADRTS